ncbi:MAG: 2-oxoglutarate oxidoreductase [Firmicutes bacterium]|nr:2-oxoglutarate oxidoreductase [Bacillota bacterium]
MSEKQVFSRTKGLTGVPFHYCPGCGHGVIHRLVAESLEELGVLGDTIGVAPVGCAVLISSYMNCDMQSAAHGRACAVATGVKRALPDRVVFTYQGDGDLAAIGIAEVMHAAARGEKITVIFVNNAIYGMTGGQMAPTTLPGQKTTTSPYGRDVSSAGFPIDMPQVLATLKGAAYVASVSVDTPKNIIQAKKAIKKAFEVQMKRQGFAFVSVLSPCPTNWGMGPLDAVKWLQDNMLPLYTMGELKTPEEAVASA